MTMIPCYFFLTDLSDKCSLGLLHLLERKNCETEPVPQIPRRDRCFWWWLGGDMFTFCI